jgi:hypothetical protein
VEKYATCWSARVATTDHAKDAVVTTATARTAAGRANRRRGPRRISAPAATTAGVTNSTWTWIDSDQNCCTGLAMALLAA